MDVVATTLRRMRGWLEVDSEPQAGTKIRLSTARRFDALIRLCQPFSGNAEVKFFETCGIDKGPSTDHILVTGEIPINIS